MDASDDYTDEMDRVSPRDIEAIVSGREVEDPAAEPFAALVQDVRRDLLQETPPGVARRHLAAMNSAARDVERASAVTTPPSRRKSMRAISQRRLAMPLVAATFVLGVGI